MTSSFEDELLDAYAARTKFGGQIGDHATTALQHVDRADEWANRDGVINEGYRDHIVDYNLRLALIHAILSVSQQVNYLTAKG